MDIKRIVLYVALAVVAMMLWNAWQQDYGTQAKAPVENTTQQTTPSALVNVPSVPNVASVTATGKSRPSGPKTEASQVPANRIITVTTDLLRVKIDKLGGNIIEAQLLKFPKKLNDKNDPVQILSDNPATYYTAQSGLTGKQGPDTAKGQVEYTSVKNNYQLENGSNKVSVNLQWKNAEGLKVNKVITFYRDKYVMDVNYNVDNQSSTAWSGHAYGQIRRLEQDKKGSLLSLHTFIGASLSTPDEHYKKYSYSKLGKKDVKTKARGGWLAMQQRYFLSAWVPMQNQINQYYSSVSSNKIVTFGFVGPLLSVAPGATATTGAKLYVGPEISARLKAIAPNLELTIDYGWLSFISVAIFWVMKHIFNVIGNWGWAIILTTLMIKLLFYKLSETSYRSMAKMRKLAPRMKQLKERYADDKQKMSQATMEMYKKEKVNPLTGCLPILVQIPFFIALYYVLIESVELRQAPFIFWIHDLSIKDPFYVLPVLMGISMFMQQKLNPPPPDPTQAKVMMMLPFVFTIFFATFPAGLVLYWLTNNCASILQQWYILRRYEKSEAAKKAKR